MTKYSVIVAFKNRDQRRVHFFLESLGWQTNKDFELIFVNQGSDEEISLSVESLIKKYSFATYIYNHTQGYLWNKSHALNIGIKSARGNYIVIADIDIIFPRDFFKKIGNHISSGIFTTHNAYYLPPNVELTKADDPFLKDFSGQCIEHFIGLCVASKEAFSRIDGYDEFYLVWGAEDDDIIKRLENSGEKRLHLNAKCTNIYHQWHKSRASSKPSLWYLTMISHLFNPVNINERSSIRGTKINKEDRPLLKLDRISIKQFTRLNFWEDNTLLFFNSFIQQFYQLGQSEIAYLEYEYKEDQVKKKFMSKLFNKNGNPIPDQNRITKQDVVDFFQYFIGLNRGYINDYRLENSDQAVFFICEKK